MYTTVSPMVFPLPHLSIPIHLQRSDGSNSAGPWPFNLFSGWHLSQSSVKRKTCVRKSVEYLGHRVDSEWLHPLNAKGNSNQTPRPTNHFKGFLNYYGHPVTATASTPKEEDSLDFDNGMWGCIHKDEDTVIAEQTVVCFCLFCKAMATWNQ